VGVSQGWWGGAVLRLLARPGLWPTALAQAFRLARRGWWRRPPFLPLPDRDYLRFRWETAYGADGRPEPDDLVAYLRWCKEFPE
jgi:hypothetical protein